MKTYKLRHEVNDIPDNENGVYWFKLRFPTPYSLGIDAKLSDESIIRLVDTVKKFSQIINNIQIKTKVTNKSRLMLIDSFRFTLHSESITAQRNKLIDIFKSKPISKLQTIIQLVQYAVNEMPPIYVGITEKQSFKERFDQHFNGESNFREGLHGLELSWDCLNLVIFPQTTYDIDYHRDIEQVFHYILKPILSKG